MCANLRTRSQFQTLSASKCQLSLKPFITCLTMCHHLGNIGGTAYICADQKLPLILQCFYRPSLLQTAKEEDGDSVKSGRGRFQVLESGISILITFHLNYFQQVGICQDQSASFKEKEVNSPERCDKNRKLVCARKQWRPQLGCCNGGNYIKTGLERTVYFNTAGRRSSPPSSHAHQMSPLTPVGRLTLLPTEEI